MMQKEAPNLGITGTKRPVLQSEGEKKMSICARQGGTAGNRKYWNKKARSVQG
jgi:hypothetical protein